MNCIIIDIETRPDPRIWDDPETVEEILEGIEAPSNYKDPAKIESYATEKLASMKASAALDPKVGKVACVGWQDLEWDDESVYSGSIGRGVIVDEDEATVLRRTVGLLASIRGGALIGGYFLRDFDLPFLTYRCAVHEIALPDWWPQRRDWNRIVDPCDLFPRDQNGSLDAHLRAMGLPRKTMSGKESLALPLPELAEYCANDVKVEAALIQRLRAHFPMLNPRKKELSA